MKIGNLLARLEDWHNAASDTNFVWFPFQFLRPLPQQKITRIRVIQMALCFGIWFGVLLLLRRWIFGSKPSAIDSLEVLAYSILGFWVWFQCVTAPLWNRRAKKRPT